MKNLILILFLVFTTIQIAKADRTISLYRGLAIPERVLIQKGERVTFVNKEDPFFRMMHSIKIPAFNIVSPALQVGEAWSFTFDKPGIFRYNCRHHPYLKMEGIIEVLP